MSDTCKTFFVTGGGTGGHIYPAIAVADELLKDGKVYYVGNPYNMEYVLTVEKGYKFLPVFVKGMPRKFSLKFISWMFFLFLSVIKCFTYILRYKPDVVFATGGYVSAPLLAACKVFKVPYVMHDCDAVPGLVSRKFSSGAKAVTLAFDAAKTHINNSNITVCGNPIRKEFKTKTKETAKSFLGLKNKLTVCITGGSQGARSINNAAQDILRELSEVHGIQVIFQTGKKNFDIVTKHLDLVYPKYRKDLNLIVKPYFADMITVMKAADIIVSRAGSLSLSEISASSAAPILIPYPYAAQDHQRFNAKSYADAEACVYIEDENLDSNVLLNSILELVKDKRKFAEIQKNCSKFANFDAVDEIKQIIIKSI